MITEAEYTEIKARYDARKAQVDEYCKAHKTNGIPGEVAATFAQCSNDETSALEVYEFCNSRPAKYIAYVKYKGNKGSPRYGQAMTLTTWTGEYLGYGWFTSNRFTSNMGDRRITFTAHGINGVIYHGTFYFGAGDYCRMRMAKEQRKGINIPQ